MKKIIRLTESDLIKLVKRVVSEQQTTSQTPQVKTTSQTPQVKTTSQTPQVKTTSQTPTKTFNMDDLGGRSMSCLTSIINTNSIGVNPTSIRDKNNETIFFPNFKYRSVKVGTNNLPLQVGTWLCKGGQVQKTPLNPQTPITPTTRPTTPTQTTRPTTPTTTRPTTPTQTTRPTTPTTTRPTTPTQTTRPTTPTTNRPTTTAPITRPT
jgi:hypothetical protein